MSLIPSCSKWLWLILSSQSLLYASLSCLLSHSLFLLAHTLQESNPFRNFSTYSMMFFIATYFLSFWGKMFR